MQETAETEAGTSWLWISERPKHIDLGQIRNGRQNRRAKSGGLFRIEPRLSTRSVSGKRKRMDADISLIRVKTNGYCRIDFAGAGRRRSLALASAPRRRSRSGQLRPTLSVKPPIFHAPTVVLAVDHHCDPLELRLPAGRRAHMIDDRPPEAFLQQVIGVLH
jgi:hypothetical protein